jgi:hypothetical protein
LLDRANDPTECLFLRLCLAGLDPDHVVALKHPPPFRQDAAAATSTDQGDRQQKNDQEETGPPDQGRDAPPVWKQQQGETGHCGMSL